MNIFDEKRGILYRYEDSTPPFASSTVFPTGSTGARPLIKILHYLAIHNLKRGLRAQVNIVAEIDVSSKLHSPELNVRLESGIAKRGEVNLISNTR
jgi:hypothetical protein